MASVVDYSKFDKIGEEEEAEAQAEQRNKVAKYKRAVARQGGKTYKYVDSDGETVSDDEDDYLARRKEQESTIDYGTGTIYEASESNDNSSKVAAQGGDNDEDSDEDSDDEELHPLFWTKMPKEGEKGFETAEMLRNLVYKNDDDEDKTPNDLAADFKEKGNEFFKWGPKFYKRALKEYKEAIQWARKGDGSDENRACYAAILSNRAAIQLKFRNYGSVVRDCKAAIEFGPDPMPNSKAHYRAALASQELGKARDADRFVKDGLKLEPDNAVLIELGKKTGAKLAEQKRVKLAKDRADAQERKLDEQMRQACLACNIKVGRLQSDIEMYISYAVGNKTQGGFPRPGYEDGSMQWPVLLMFPEKMQTDFIQSFDLRHRFRDHLEMMFPINRSECPGPKVPPWDEGEFQYTLDSMEVYFEERHIEPFDMQKMWGPQYARTSDKVDWGKKLRVRVGLDKTLLDAISDKNYVVPGLPTFIVVSNRSKYYTDTFVPSHKDRLRTL